MNRFYGARRQMTRSLARRAGGVALALIVGGLVLLAFPASPAHASCGGDAQFIVTATAANTSGYIMTLDDPTLNGAPLAVPEVTELWPSQYDPHPLGIWYNSSSARWTVFNEDLASIPLGTSFAVGDGCIGHLGSRSVFRFSATATNVQGDAVFIDDPTTNGNPSAVVFATQAWIGTYNAHEIGVNYNISNGKWSIYNLDLSAMPVGAAFDVWAGTTAASPSTLAVKASASNTFSGYMVYLNDSRFNNKPGLAPMVTQVLPSGPCGKGGCGVINNHTVGVWYDSVAGQWVVYNVDRAPVAAGAWFFVSAEV